jgi:3-oxoadipate enol-lactonase
MSETSLASQASLLELLVETFEQYRAEGMKRSVAMKSGFLEVNGASLWFEDSGAGFPVVLLHGGLVHSSVWDELTTALSDRHRVIRFDARGHGKSLLPPGTFVHANDLLTVLNALKVERAALIGLSMGGNTAIEFTLTHPERVAGLVLIGSGLNGYDTDASVGQSWQAVGDAYNRGDLNGAAEITLRFWTDGTNRTPDQVNPQARSQVREMTLQNFRIPEPETPAEEDSLVPDAVPRLYEIHQPTLVMVGANDVPDFVEIANTLEREIPGARKVVFQDAAHHLPLEYPDRFQALVLEFLAGIA